MAVKKTKVSNALYTVVTFLILETVSLFLVYNSSYANNLFFTRIGRSVSGFFYSVTSSVGGYFSLKKQNEKLHAQNVELLNRYFNNGDSSGLAAQNDEVSDEILRAKAAQNDGVPFPCKFLAAEVIGTRKGSNHNYFIINKGRKDGVEKSMGVITPHGVVGIVDAVSRNVSIVVSMQSFRMNVSARIGHDGPVGPVFWSGARTARMENIPLHFAAAKGDTVYTSGFSMIFPPDIPLGTIKSSSSQKGLSNALELELFEDLRALRYVTVVKSDFKKELKGHE